MSDIVTIGLTFATSRLTAQPFAYEGEARTGLTARTFEIRGLLTPEEWQTLIAEYDAWRNLRIADADTLASGIVGTTILLTIDQANGLVVTNLPCWFADPPSGAQLGTYIDTSVTLVDANQALAVLLRTEEKNRERSEDIPALGTVTLGSAVVTLTKPMLTRRDTPNVALTAAGKSYITGPYAAHEARDIEGFITSGTYTDVLTWYDTTIADDTPAAGTWFPVTAPTATAENIIDAGVKVVRYTVQVSAVKII